MKDRLAAARVARLATVGHDGRPHVVPISFAVAADTLFFAVDSKPKRSRDLQRLRNIAVHPEVSVLVDHYGEDWSTLWWVRADGKARVVADPAESGRAIDLLAARYPQYQEARPLGPVVAVEIGRISGWSARQG